MVCKLHMQIAVLHVIRLLQQSYPEPFGFHVLECNPIKRHSEHGRQRNRIFPDAFTVSDKDESCEEMSVPSSPQNEAIQHSSVSTSNGVSSSSSSSTTPAVSAPPSAAAATSKQSTEESQPRRASTRSQPSGS